MKKIHPDISPELTRLASIVNEAKDLILNILLNEETKFKQTIDNGLNILEDEIAKPVLSYASSKAINENQLLGGQQDNNWSVVCTAHRVRSSNLNIERVRSI